MTCLLFCSMKIQCFKGKIVILLHFNFMAGRLSLWSGKVDKVALRLASSPVHYNYHNIARVRSRLHRNKVEDSFYENQFIPRKTTICRLR